MMDDLGQLIFTGIRGVELTTEEKKFLNEENIGGVILFSHNYENPAQLKELAGSIQSLKKNYPFYISVDHEGGRVFRFKDFVRPPSMYDLARLSSLDTVFKVAQIMALELHSCGVNLNYSPVCDVWNNKKNQVIGDRAFGHDGNSVSPFVATMIQGLQTNGISACAKHFPGHGCTLEDSHYQLPMVRKKMDDLRTNEFLPFAKAIESGVEFVMMAHIIVDSIDGNLPCSLSEKAHKILREELQFEKIIIADDMQMKAIFDNYGTTEAVVAAVKAGANVAIYRDREHACLALEGLKKSVSDKKIPEVLIRERVSRIETSKEKFFSSPKPPIDTEIGSEENRAFMDAIEEKITLL